MSNVCVFFPFFSTDMIQLQPLRRCQRSHGAPFAAAQAPQATHKPWTHKGPKRHKKGNPKAPRTEQKPLCVGRVSHILLGKADTQTLDTQRFFCTPKGRSAESPAKPLCVSSCAHAALKGAREHLRRLILKAQPGHCLRKQKNTQTQRKCLEIAPRA